MAAPVRIATEPSCIFGSTRSELFLACLYGPTFTWQFKPSPSLREKYILERLPIQVLLLRLRSGYTVITFTESKFATSPDRVPPPDLSPGGDLQVATTHKILTTANNHPPAFDDMEDTLEKPLGRLERFPLEVRREIYSYLLADFKQVHNVSPRTGVVSRSARWQSSLPLVLSVSKTMRGEVADSMLCGRIAEIKIDEHAIITNFSTLDLKDLSHSLATRYWDIGKYH